MTIVFTNCKISCFLVRESIKTYVTKLMHDFIQIIHPRSRNQCTVKQTDMQADKLSILHFTYCDIWRYLLWNLLLPVVTHWFLPIVKLMFFIVTIVYMTDWYRQTSYCSLHLSYCDIYFHPLWHWFVLIVVSIFNCDNDFYRSWKFLFRSVEINKDKGHNMDV